MTALRAGIIGLGVGEQHIAGYRAHPAVEVVAVCDHDPSKLALAKERYPELLRAAAAAELLVDPDIDVISIASYDDAHFEQVRTALENGKHVFAEKPLVLYDHELRDIRALLRQRPTLALSSNVPLRLSPRFVEIKEMIQAGDFGRLFHLEGDYDYGRRHKLTDGWRGQLPHYSAVLGGAIHMVDLLLWLSDERVVEVTAMSNRIATDKTEFRHPDFVAALLKMESGATAKVNANLGCVSPHFHGVRIYGTEATFINGLPDGVLYRSTGTPEQITSTPVTSPYPGVQKGDLIYSFVEQIVTGKPALVTAEDVFTTLDVCFAIERSARERATVAVEPLG